jgi:acetyl esterase/lipase
MRRTALVLLVALLVGTAAWIWPPGRAAVKTALLLPHLFPGSQVRPFDLLTPAPVREELTFRYPSATGRIDLYHPPEPGRYPAVIFFLGVAPLASRDPRVVQIAQGLARSGLAVAVLESPHLVAEQIVPEEVDGLVDAFGVVSRHPAVDPGRVGFAGFCVGAALALVAAADPRIADRVRFVNALTPYYDGEELLAEIASRQFEVDGQVVSWNPSLLTQKIFNQLLERARTAGAGPLAERLAAGPDLSTARGLVGQLPEAARRETDLLSPKGKLDRIRARVYVMHDRDDNNIPVAQARRLVRDFPDKTRLVYTEFEFFEHVEPTKPVDPVTFGRELGKFYAHVYRVLAPVW